MSTTDTEDLGPPTDNGGQPFHNHISFKHLDFAVVDWCEKFFDRAVLPCKEWMDGRTWLDIKRDADRMREIAIDGGELNEIKRLASGVLQVCANEFQFYQQRTIEQHAKQLLQHALKDEPTDE